MERREPTDGSRVSRDKNSVTFWVNRLEHQHDYHIGNSVRLLALPTAPLGHEILTVDVQLFCEEFRDWVTQPLKLRLVDSDGGTG